MYCLVFSASATPVLYTLSLHDALPIFHPEFAAGDLDGDGRPDIVGGAKDGRVFALSGQDGHVLWAHDSRSPAQTRPVIADAEDRKSTRLNSSHLGISYAVFCLKKKKKQ